jgi:hypothetical protein
MHGENTYPEVVHHCFRQSPVVSIRSKPVVLPSSGELPGTIPRRCHHTRVVEMNQFAQHLVDQSLPLVPFEAIVNPGPIDITKSVN